MHGKPFLDTNIFLYAFSANEPDKQKIAKELILLDSVISAQVINETSVNLIKKIQAFWRGCARIHKKLLC